MFGRGKGNTNGARSNGGSADRRAEREGNGGAAGRGSEQGVLLEAKDGKGERLNDTLSEEQI